MEANQNIGKYTECIILIQLFECNTCKEVRGSILKLDTKVDKGTE